MLAFGIISTDLDLSEGPMGTALCRSSILSSANDKFETNDKIPVPPDDKINTMISVRLAHISVFITSFQSWPVAQSCSPVLGKAKRRLIFLFFPLQIRAAT